MAISLISGGALSGAVTNGGAVTLTFPAGVLQNDVVYVCSGTDGTATVSTSGYSLIGTVTSTSQVVQVWRKIMGATPDTNVVINGTGQPQDAHAVVAFILRGVETSQPEDATATTASGSSTNPDNPAITTVTNRAWVLAFASSRVNDAAITAPSGYINQTSANATDTNPSTTAVASEEITVAGVENPASWTNWDTGTWGAITVAVRPGGFISVPVTGVAGTGQVGTVQVNESVQVSATGVQATGQLGTVGVAFPIVVPVTGVQASGAVDSVQALAGASVLPFGVLGITALGEEDTRAFAFVSLTGVEGTGQVGDVNFRFGIAVFVSGVLCTASTDGSVVWIGINDGQFGVWTPVDDSQPQIWVPVPV